MICHPLSACATILITWLITDIGCRWWSAIGWSNNQTRTQWVVRICNALSPIWTWRWWSWSWSLSSSSDHHHDSRNDSNEHLIFFCFFSTFITSRWTTMKLPLKKRLVQSDINCDINYWMILNSTHQLQSENRQNF